MWTVWTVDSGAGRAALSAGCSNGHRQRLRAAQSVVLGKVTDAALLLQGAAAATAASAASAAR